MMVLKMGRSRLVAVRDDEPMDRGRDFRKGINTREVELVWFDLGFDGVYGVCGSVYSSVC